MRIYGPVPSRRFGLSLGVDLIPFKTCPFDCIYCQLGETDTLSSTLKQFYTMQEILADVKKALKDNPKPDVITLAGSGEPTLYKGLDVLIDELKKLDDIPVLLITNAALLWKKEVAAAALKANILAPSLDAGDEKTFARVNRPHIDITFEKFLKGLRDVTNAHTGEIRLEIMLIKNVNDSEKSMRAMANLLKDIRYDRIDLNTPVRPPVPERGALPCNDDTLAMAQKIFGPKAHPIGSFIKKRDTHSLGGRSFDDRDKDVREMLMRRPCTAKDISDSMNINIHEVIKIIGRLVQAGLATEQPSDKDIYYRAG